MQIELASGMGFENLKNVASNQNLGSEISKRGCEEAPNSRETSILCTGRCSVLRALSCLGYVGLG